MLHIPPERNHRGTYSAFIVVKQEETDCRRQWDNVEQLYRAAHLCYDNINSLTTELHATMWAVYTVHVQACEQGVADADV